MTKITVLGVQEAVYLADRVAVMSARPGRIKTIVETKFDKNDPEHLQDQAFVDKVDALWNLVRDEAIKAGGAVAMRQALFRYLPLVLLALAGRRRLASAWSRRRRCRR